MRNIYLTLLTLISIGYTFSISANGLPTSSIKPQEESAALSSFVELSGEEKSQVRTLESLANLPYYNRPFVIGGQQFVEVSFLNNSDFPRKYAGDRGMYFDDDSQLYREQTDALIMKYYLDGEFDDLAPELIIVSSNVATIRFQIDYQSQLEDLLSLENIAFVRHRNFKQKLIESR